MYTIQAKMVIKPEVRASFLADTAALMAATRIEEGCLSYNLYEAVADSNHFVMVEEWASQEAIDQHNQAPLLQAFAAKMGEYSAAAPVIQVFTAVN